MTLIAGAGGSAMLQTSWSQFDAGGGGGGGENGGGDVGPSGFSGQKPSG